MVSQGDVTNLCGVKISQISFGLLFVTHSAKAPLSGLAQLLTYNHRISPFLISPAGTSAPISTTSPTTSAPTMTPGGAR